MGSPAWCCIITYDRNGQLGKEQIATIIFCRSELTFFFDSPVCIEERNILYHSLEEWYTLAGFVQSEESKKEERKIWQLKYEKIKNTLNMLEFLNQAKYQNYLSC